MFQKNIYRYNNFQLSYGWFSMFILIIRYFSKKKLCNVIPEDELLASFCWGRLYNTCVPTDTYLYL